MLDLTISPQCGQHLTSDEVFAALGFVNHVGWLGAEAFSVLSGLKLTEVCESHFFSVFSAISPIAYVTQEEIHEQSDPKIMVSMPMSTISKRMRVIPPMTELNIPPQHKKSAKP